jgi:YesN/AraC family two-component response regulator
MPFSVEEFHDLVRILEERPEWRSELRRLILTDHLLALPEQMTELRAYTEQRFQALAAAQQRTEERLTALVAAQQRTEERLTALTAAQQRTEERLTALTAAQQGTEERLATVSTQLADLILVVRTFATDLGELKGRNLEYAYSTKVYAYFSRIVRRAHALSPDELTSLLEDAIDRRVLSEEQAQDVSLADVIVRGRRRTDGAEVFLVVEISWGVGPQDVERAMRRASLLAHTGTPALPVVAGTWVTSEAANLARAQQVWQLTNGHAIRPE